MPNQRSYALPVSLSLSKLPSAPCLDRYLPPTFRLQLLQVSAVTRQKRRCTFFCPQHAALWTQRLAKGHVQNARTHTRTHTIHTMGHTHTPQCTWARWNTRTLVNETKAVANLRRCQTSPPVASACQRGVPEEFCVCTYSKCYRLAFFLPIFKGIFIRELN